MFITVTAILLSFGILLRWRAGTFPITGKLLILSVTAICMLAAMSSLALAYSRTARSTRFLYDNGRRAFVICTSNTQCFDYSVDSGFRQSKPGSGNDMRDVLNAYLDDMANRPDVSPPPTANTWR
jgi:hypothetical protein